MSGRHAKTGISHNTFDLADLNQQFDEASKWIQAFRHYYQQFDRIGADRTVTVQKARRTVCNIDNIIEDIGIIADCLSADKRGLDSDTVDKIRMLHELQVSMHKQLAMMRATADSQDLIDHDIADIERYANREKGAEQ